VMAGYPSLHPRTSLVNTARNEINRLVSPVIVNLTLAEIAYIFSEIAFRWTVEALKQERDPK